VSVSLCVYVYTSNLVPHICSLSADIRLNDGRDKESAFRNMDLGELEGVLTEHASDNGLKNTLRGGIGFYHNGLVEGDRKLVAQLFNNEAISVVIVDKHEIYGLPMRAHFVCVMGSQQFDGIEHRYADIPITEMLAMVGVANRPRQDTTSKCSVFAYSPRVQFLSKFLLEPFPVESHFDSVLADHLNVEITTKRIENVQVCESVRTFVCVSE
jgi:pre-mRNA-splicing helicase BRR2